MQEVYSNGIPQKDFTVLLEKAKTDNNLALALLLFDQTNPDQKLQILNLAFPNGLDQEQIDSFRQHPNYQGAVKEAVESFIKQKNANM